MSVVSLPQSADSEAQASIDAERAVLGGLMLDNARFEEIADRLAAKDFYRRDHQLVFAAISHHADRATPFDVVTISDWLKARGELEEAGGMAYLIALARETPSAVNVKAYAGIVAERAMRRELIRAGGDIADLGRTQADVPSADLVDEAERRVLAVAESKSSADGPVRAGDALGDVADTIATLEERARRGELAGLSTGLSDLDTKTAGLQPGDLVIVAGRPSMGKTALAMRLAETAAVDHHLPTAIFSMEMPRVQLIMRLLSQIALVDGQNLMNGRCTETDTRRIGKVMSAIDAAPLWIEESSALSPTGLCARARRLKREAQGLSLIVVDYLQLMQVPGTRENRATEISEISRSLKGLAMELGVPVVALSQLNRSVEQRPNKRPVMSDLRESGSIEQDADVIMMLYRDEYYNENSADKGLAEIIITKQRNGPTGTVKAAFLERYTRFESYTPEAALPEGVV